MTFTDEQVEAAARAMMGAIIHKPHTLTDGEWEYVRLNGGDALYLTSARAALATLAQPPAWGRNADLGRRVREIAETFAQLPWTVRGDLCAIADELEGGK